MKLGNFVSFFINYSIASLLDTRLICGMNKSETTSENYLLCEKEGVLTTTHNVISPDSLKVYIDLSAVF